MTDDPQMSFEQPRSMFGTWLGVVLLFALFGLLVWVVLGISPRGDSYEQKRAQARLEKLKAAHDEANTTLNGYAWVDKEKGTVRIPIQRAMEMSMTELAQKKPAAANPIAPADTGQPGLQTTAPAAPSAAATAPPAAAPSPAPKPIAIEGKDSAARGQPAAAANPANVAPGTQPGPSATAAATPPAGASMPQPNPSAPTATPVRSPPGTPLPIPGKSP